MKTRAQQMGYFLHEAILNMSRNLWLNVMAVGMIAVSLSIFGIFWLIYNNLNAVARRRTEAVQIIAYVRDGLSDTQRLELDGKIRELDYVEGVTYISPDEALQLFTARLGDHADLLDGLQTNPLPASYEIQLVKKHREMPGVRKVVEQLQQFSEIEDLQYGEKWLESLTIIINMLTLVGIFLGVFLFLTVIFVISNTIKLTLYSREEEVTIMKFIGATETFIKGPFLMEGVIRGFLGALLSLAVLFVLYRLFMAILGYSSHALLVFSSISFLSWIAGISLTVLGSFLGWCGSLFTLRKFLKTY